MDINVKVVHTSQDGMTLTLKQTLHCKDKRVETQSYVIIDVCINNDSHSLAVCSGLTLLSSTRLFVFLAGKIRILRLPLLLFLIRLFFVSSGAPCWTPLVVFPYKEVAGQPAALLGPDLPRANP